MTAWTWLDFVGHAEVALDETSSGAKILVVSSVKNFDSGVVAAPFLKILFLLSRPGTVRGLNDHRFSVA